MKRISAVLVAAALAGCGVETASTAATAAALKKQEVEQGRKTMEQAQKKIGQSMEQMQQARDAAEK
jgi:hypothetical protein